MLVASIGCDGNGRNFHTYLIYTRYGYGGIDRLENGYAVPRMPHMGDRGYANSFQVPPAADRHHRLMKW
jgi:hypothetical protein